jgi:salicylate biosynthesis isochorismate synthase
MYSCDVLENNSVVSPSGPERRFAAMWTPLEAGALLRLSINGGPLSVAWSHPARGEWATGVGVAGEGGGAIDWSNGAPPPGPGPWFGGWTFEGAERWVLPKVLAWWSGGRTYAAAFGEDAAQALAAIEEAEPVIEVPRARVEAGDRAAWSAMIEAALGQISSGALSKVVLARRLIVRSQAPFEERRILKVLEARYPSCRTFLLRTEEGSAFLGATPETLCRVRGRVLETEALAGTGTGDELLSSAKDLREHAWVVEAIVESLRPYATSVDVAEAPGLRRLANVTHLWTPIRAELREGVDPILAARALHPTPAVGGTPREEAVAFQRAREGCDRGWYAGAIGARGPEGLELCVGIRSALVHGAEATVFAGAGIVAGSTADSEWVETERKASALLGALGVTDV